MALMCGPSEDVDDEPNEAMRELSRCLQPMLDQISPAGTRRARSRRRRRPDPVASARQLGLSLSGMKSRVQRARRDLKELLEQCCAVEVDRRGGVTDYRPVEGGCDCNPATQSAAPDQPRGHVTRVGSATGESCTSGSAAADADGRRRHRRADAGAAADTARSARSATLEQTGRSRDHRALPVGEVERPFARHQVNRARRGNSTPASVPRARGRLTISSSRCRCQQSSTSRLSAFCGAVGMPSSPCSTSASARTV